jgi:hypothetical protein
MAGKTDGAEGRHIVRNGKDGQQIIAARGHRWTDEDEAVFLDCLAATCNVTLAAEKAGFSTEAIYRRRRRDPGFAERWQAALAQGYARIEIALVRRAADTLEGVAPDPDVPLATLTVRDAVAILRGSILAKLEAIEAVRTAAVPTEGGNAPADAGAPE